MTTKNAQQWNALLNETQGKCLQAYLQPAVDYATYKTKTVHGERDGKTAWEDEKSDESDARKCNPLAIKSTDA